MPANAVYGDKKHEGVGNGLGGGSQHSHLGTSICTAEDDGGVGNIVGSKVKNGSQLSKIKRKSLQDQARSPWSSYRNLFFGKEWTEVILRSMNKEMLKINKRIALHSPWTLSANS